MQENTGVRFVAVRAAALTNPLKQTMDAEGLTAGWQMKERIPMAADLSTINWKAIVRARWRGAEIYGTGPYACVVRCGNPTAVHLFETSAEAESFKAAFCKSDFCSHRHNVGSLLPFVPARPAPKPLRNQGLFERE